MKKRRVKLEDIARKLNISIATVSRALDESPRVKPSTREKVFRMAKAMGYMPNQIAKSLSSGKTNLIGVIIPRYDESFFIEVCRGIDHYVSKYNYKILISSSRTSFESEQENLSFFEKGLVDGIILCPSHDTETFSHIRSIINKGIPTVLFDNIKEEVSGADHVLINDSKASFSAIEYFIKKGKKKIVFIGGIRDKKVFQDRYGGYLNALKKYNIPIDEDLILHCNSLDREEENLEISRYFISLKKRPDAVFTVTDSYGMMSIKILTKLNYNIPKDVEVIGFGDLGVGKVFVPSLTCVAQPSFEMGLKSAELLIDQLNDESDEKHKKRVITLETKIVFRESTGHLS